MTFLQSWLLRTPALLVSASCTVATATGAAESTSEAAPAVTARVRTLPANVTIGLERVRLPRNEGMGLLGATYLFELEPGWWLGPALYGAASGQRGGLFTWGAEGQRRWRLGERWVAATGLYVGGGGGAGAPVGGGLMLRPHADLMFDLGTWAVGVTASQVRFPSGAINSTQFGFQLAVRDDFAFAAPGYTGQLADFGGAGGVRADRMHPTVGRYATGTIRAQPLHYVGMRLERQLSSVMSATVEAAGAAAGGADGYAEALGGVLMLWPLGEGTARVGIRAAVGLGGGGAVPTGGGPIAKLAFSSRLQFSERLSLELETGKARAFNGDLNSRYAQLSVGVKLGDTPAQSGAAAWGATVHDMEWALSLQTYLNAQRKDGGERRLSALGLKFRRALSEYLYLSGQAHGAITGGAGAYSVGLVGVGATLRFGAQAAWSVGAEAMAGAAGGGGVAIRGGAILQPMAWLGRDLGRYSRIKVGAGYVKSVRGELSSPVIDLTWAIAFGTP